jgi:hypothetical protein
VITSVEAVTTWVGDPTIPDDVITAAWEGAESYIGERTDYPTEDPDGLPLDPPDDLVQAVNLLTARYLARRNSPDGIVGMGDLGPANVPVIDRDVERLMDPWRFFPVA